MSSVSVGQARSTIVLPHLLHLDCKLAQHATSNALLCRRALARLVQGWEGDANFHRSEALANARASRCAAVNQGEESVLGVLDERRRAFAMATLCNQQSTSATQTQMESCVAPTPEPCTTTSVGWQGVAS